MNYSNIKAMSIYRKLFGEKKMAHKYVSIERVLNSDDWGLIINKDGELKGLYIPAGKDDDEVPFAIQTICEKFFGVDWADEEIFENTIH